MAEASTADRGKSDLGKSDLGKSDLGKSDLGKGKRITGGDRSTLAGDLRKRYDGGESIRSLAESTNRSYGFVHRLLSESGATLRSRGGANRNSKKKA